MIVQIGLLIVALFIWALVHSLTAGRRAKHAFRERFGDRAYEGLYRLLYNLFSLATFLLVMVALAAVVPNRLLYSVPMPYRLINFALQGIGLVGLAYALWQTDIFSFAGVRQFWRYLTGEEIVEAQPRFITTGAYGVVRHPLYLFSLLFLWANPDMTLQSLVLYLYVTIYFYIGSIYEERRLAAVFGDAYATYRDRVPRFLPVRLPG
ncbi:MAG: isoprenylcysteine carboxylmethyltransferase family protein [Chloroflexota bacterium]